jgi:hypothetical protein
MEHEARHDDRPTEALDLCNWAIELERRLLLITDATTGYNQTVAMFATGREPREIATVADLRAKIVAEMRAGIDRAADGDPIVARMLSVFADNVEVGKVPK